MITRCTKPGCPRTTRIAASGSSLCLGRTAVRVEKSWPVNGLGVQQVSERGQMGRYSANVNFEDHLPPLIV